MAHVVTLLLLGMAVVSPLVMSQPFTQTGTSRRTDFKWNSRKVGNKKIATLTIRKDEERDRRSIPLLDEDETRPHHHRHRHHHGDPPHRFPEGAEGDNIRVASPLYVAESSALEMVSPNDVRPESGGSQGRSTNRLAAILEDLRQTPAPRANTGRGRDGHQDGPGQATSRRARKGKKAKKKRRKGSKGCQRLKGKSLKKKCRAALKQCRRLRGKERKKCRAEAVGGSMSHHDNAPAPRLRGQEACQYHNLRDCSTKIGLLDHTPGNMLPVDKCHYREEFLKCMQERLLSHCDPNSSAHGNMTALRMQIRDVVRVGATSSCIVSEVLEG